MLDLTEKCSSKFVPTIDAAIAYLTAHDEEDVISTLSKYPDIDKKCDSIGRTLLHIAASQGKNIVIRWLFDQGANLLATDFESHWTALHRAAFYGYLDTISLLIQLAVKESQKSARKGREFNSERFLTIKDKEGLTYLDLLIADGRPFVCSKMKGLNVTFTWGLNVNNNLGHERSQAVQTPDKVDCFRNSKINIAMVSIGTYHTIFLSHSGEVYTCGHGVGGRLGHGDEVSLLTPRRVTALSNEKCGWVSASFNQSFFITTSGVIYGCGMNIHNLLLSGGVDKSLTPKVLAMKCLKNLTVEKIFGHKNHLVIQTSSSIFTYGLNAGQLGHPKIDNERLISQPRCVTKLNSVCKVATSDAASAVVTREGQVFLLQDYTCKKIFMSHHYCNPDCLHKKENESCVKDICISGGRLDEGALNKLSDRVKPRSLIVVVMFQTGKMYLWTEASKVLSQIIFFPRFIKAQDIALSRSSNLLAMTSAEGQLWQGHVPYETKTFLTFPDTPLKMKDFTMVSDRPIKSQDLVDVTFTRVYNVHRAEQVTVDDKGTNFALIASCPKFGDNFDSKNDKLMKNIANLKADIKPKLWFGYHRASLDPDATEMGDILKSELHSNIEYMPDTILKSKEGGLFTCHQDVLTSRAPYFESMFRQYNKDEDFIMGWCETTSSTTPISMNLSTPVLSILLTHIYYGRLDSCQQRDLGDYNVMCQCLLASDQYIMDDLKLSIEQHLCKLVTLKNVTYLASLSSALNAQFLESSTLEFICHNAPCLLESGAFSDVEPEILARINFAYRNFINKQSLRTITPYEPLPLPTGISDKLSAMKKKRKNSKIILESIKENGEHQKNATAELTDTTRDTAVVVGEVKPSMTMQTANCDSKSSTGGAELNGNKVPDVTRSCKGPIKKISQKSRKEEEKKRRLKEKEDQKAAAIAIVNAVTIVNAVKSAPVNPWKISNNNNNIPNSPASSPTSLSFKALMQLDLLGEQLISDRSGVRSQVRSTHSASKGKVTDKNNISNNGSFSDERHRVSLVTTNPTARQHQKDNFSTTPTSPWGKIPAIPVDFKSCQRSEASHSDLFDSIMKEEKDQLETRHRVTNKSLHLVQLEECAMEELKAYYGALDGHEHIVITRAPLNVSRPYWAANQRSKKAPS